ncbi:MAG TPA: rhodanese-like domain-containing protein [Myxococcaceae bacterium]|jgi:rhodanese-related sulfurtransferase|nr:rhodanese-like domain-containing protein [Myxococcaceae bacterium]
MRIHHAVVAAVAVTFVPLATYACEGHEKRASAKMVTLDDAAKLQKEKLASFLDANSIEIRAKYGVIPGATLLSNFTEYQTAELPKDKDAKLVFYCANTRCSAAHKAAVKALHAGYTDVNVLPDGIIGWKNAGQPTSLPRS